MGRKRKSVEGEEEIPAEVTPKVRPLLKSELQTLVKELTDKFECKKEKNAKVAEEVKNLKTTIEEKKKELDCSNQKVIQLEAEKKRLLEEVKEKSAKGGEVIKFVTINKMF